MYRGLSIRLALHGCSNRPFFQLVVVPQHRARNAKPIEQIGSVDPMVNAYNEKLVAINYDRLRYWLSKGGKPTKPVLKLMGLSGYFPLHPMTIITARRNAKKETAADVSEE